MQLTVSNILLTAKQHEIAELKRLSTKAQLVGVIGHLVHALQSERGASSIYLASSGCRFDATRRQLIEESESIERTLRGAFEEQMANASFGDARQFSLMAWVLLGLDSLPAFRQQVANRELTPEQAVVAISRLIAGLVSLIFEVTDAVLDPVISRSLVALFHFIQGKEHAGQERAVGALSFASGVADGRHQQRIHHLIDAQERCLQVFQEFASDAAREQWRIAFDTMADGRIERYRRILLSVAPGVALDSNHSDEWFDCCTVRLNCMWDVQKFLVGELLDRCAQLIEHAERDLTDATGMLEDLKSHPPASTFLVDRFFSPEEKIDVALKIMPGQGIDGGLDDSLVEMLLAQSDRLARVEGELETARRALNERKIIERAKGLLMARLNIAEDAAYKMLRQTSMDQKRPMVDIAEAMLTLPGLIAPDANSSGPPKKKPLVL